MFGLLGAFAGGTMAMTQDELVDRDAAPNGALDRKHVKENNGAQNYAAPNGVPARAPWLKRLDSYDRQQRREFQVTRYG
jgi:hypothetical protein